MKRIISILLTAVICFALASCAIDSEAPEGMQRASNDKVAYVLWVPQTWSLGAASEYASAYYSVDDPSNVSVFFFAPEGNMTVEEYWKSFEEEYKETFPTLELVESSTTLLGERAAGKYVFTATVSGDDYKFMQYIAEYGGMIYTLTYTAPIDKYDLHTQEVEAIANNFKFR